MALQLTSGLTGILKLDTDKNSEFGPLHDRQDDDYKLIDTAPFTLKKYDKTEVPDAYSVTLPNAAIFFQKMVELIASGAPTPQINGKNLSDDDKAYITNYLTDTFYEKDATLSRRGKYSTHTAQSGFICGRGWVGTDVLVRMKDGKLIYDVRYLDTRYLTWSGGMDDLDWRCYTMRRTRSDIFKTYGIEINQAYGIVKDNWTREFESVFIDGDLKKEIENGYGYVPTVIVPAPFGPGYIGEEDAIKRYGESIFYPHRGMFEHMNYMASISKTQTFDDLRPSLAQITDNLNDKRPKKYPTSQTITNWKQQPTTIPTRGFTESMRYFSGLIDSILQRAGLSTVEEGNIPFPVAGIVLARLMGVKASLTAPRHQALSLLYSAVAMMELRQVQAIGGTIEIGQEGMKRSYDTAKLGGPFTVSWTFPVSTLEDRATRMAIANAEKGTISKRTIRRTTLEMENPEEEESFLEVEQAKEMEPIIIALERIFSLIKEHTKQANAEAWILWKRTEQILIQRLSQGTQEFQPQPEAKPTQQLKVFNSGGQQQGRP